MVEQLNGHLLAEALAIGYFSSNSDHLVTTLAQHRPAMVWCQAMYSSPTHAAIFLLAQTRNLPFSANMPATERTACNLTPIDAAV